MRFNEDDHFDLDQSENNFAAAVGKFAAWSDFDFRREGEMFVGGYQSVPVNWKTSRERNKGFFKLLSDITGEKPLLFPARCCSDHVESVRVFVGQASILSE